MRIVFTAFLSFFLCLTACADSDIRSAPKGPALWEVKDADTRITFFGTIHLLSKKTKWQKTYIMDRFDSADIVYFETPGDPSPELMRSMIALGLNKNGRKLSDLLNAQERQNLKQAADYTGMPLNGLESMRPWLAALNLDIAAMGKGGLKPDLGVESILEPRAKNAGQDLRYFETNIEQMHFFADLSDDIQLEFLREVLIHIESIVEEIQKLAGYWLYGDVDSLSVLIVDEMKAETPEFYNVFLTRRNAKWTEELTRVMHQEEGEFFVAVGAAHLAGPDSVQAMLEKRGFEVKRIDPGAP